MNCQNSLVSLAYIETSKNPLQVFCNFILYLLLKAPNQTLRADEIKEQLQSDFGISMPHQIISNCTRILERKQEVIRLPHAAGYKIGDTSFDIDSFENTRQRFAEHENKLLNSLVEFVSSQYKQKWSEEEAKKYLSNFLDTEGYGTQLFLKKKLELEQHYGPFQLTERSGQHDAENTHRGKVAQRKRICKGCAHIITCFRRKAYSRYCRRISADFPCGMGICARFVRVTARVEMFWIYSIFTRKERCVRRKLS